MRAGAPGAEERLADPAPVSVLELVHPPAYLEALDAACATGGWIDADTWVEPGSALAYRLAAGGAVAAVEAVSRGEADAAISCLRPPGHHASGNIPMGFCLVNNAAVAARAAQRGGTRRVAVVDWDVHHGNGTQDVFWEDGDVLMVSLHQWPQWPGSGREDERGAADGEGATLNVCIPPGSGSELYRSRFEGEVLPAVEAFRPELVIVSCGFDAHRDDPLAELELDAADFGRLTAGLVEVAARVGAPRPVVLLEGGYDLGAVEASMREVAAALTAG